MNFKARYLCEAINYERCPQPLRKNQTRENRQESIESQRDICTNKTKPGIAINLAFFTTLLPELDPQSSGSSCNNSAPNF